MRSHATELSMWVALIGSAGATIFPDYVLVNDVFGFIDRRAVRLIAIPLFIVAAVVLTDFHYHWTRGLI